MKKLLATFLLLLGLSSPALAQNPTCPTRPAGDSSNACASTAFVQNALGTTCTTLGSFLVGTGSGVVCSTSPAPLAAVLNGTLNLFPLAGSFQQGLNITQSGPNGGASVAGPKYYNVISPFFNSTVTGTRNVSGLQVSFGTGGSANAAEIYGISGGVTQTASGVIGEQIGISGGVQILDGFSSNNNIYGLTGAATVNVGASAPVAVGIESGVAIFAVAGVPIRYGLNVDNYGAFTATGMDTAISIQGGFVGGSWKRGLTFTNPGGTLAPALATTGIMFSAEVAMTVATIFDWSNVTATTLMTAQYALLTGVGALSLGGTSNTGQVSLLGSGSGTATIKPQAAAGTPTITLGTSSGTPAVTASSPLVITAATGNITCPTCATSSGGGAITGTAPIAVSAAGVVSLNDAGVTYAKIQNLGALAIMGRSANSSGVGADIQATAASDAVFRESGSTIGFGTIATAGIANNAVTLAKLATQTTNTVLGNATSGSAVPIALAVASCSTASSTLNWTTNTGFGCNTSITANAVAVGGITGLGTGVATALATNIGSAGAFVTFNGALGTPSSGTVTNLTGTASININGTVGATTPTTGAFTTLTATGASITISNANPSIFINKAASGADNIFAGQTGGLNRWVLDFGNNTAESGGNAGSNLDINRYNDAGTFQATSFRITRSNGAISMPELASTSTAQTGTVCWTTGTGNLTVDTTTTCLLSSSRFKHDIRPLDGDSLSKVMALRPVSYEYNADLAIAGEQIGLIAEDVVSIDDRLVSHNAVDGSVRSVRYQQLTAVLAGAIQQLKADNDNIREELKLRKAQ